MDSKRNILVFIDWFYPGYRAGGPISSCVNMFAHLADNYNYKVVCRNTDYCSATPYEGVTHDAWNRISDNVEVFYISQPHLTASTIKRLIADTSFGVAYINGIYSFYFSILPLFYLKKRKKTIIIAPRGMFSGQALQIKSIKKQFFLLATKLIGFYQNIIFHSTSNIETVDIQRLFPHNEARFAPNLPRKAGEIKGVNAEKTQGQLRLINVGRIAAEKNTLFAIQSLQNIDGEVSMHLYGEIYTDNYWQQCRAAIAQLPPNVKVEYKGVVPQAALVQLLPDYHFMFMPSLGENFGHAIAESLQSGVPVIISDKTPWQNLQAQKAGWDIALNQPQEFEQVLARCVRMDNADYATHSAAALQLAYKYLQNSEIREQSIALFENL